EFRLVGGPDRVAESPLANGEARGFEEPHGPATFSPAGLELPAAELDVDFPARCGSFVSGLAEPWRAGAMQVGSGVHSRSRLIRLEEADFSPLIAPNSRLGVIASCAIDQGHAHLWTVHEFQIGDVLIPEF